jgi:hypothetical protein
MHDPARLPILTLEPLLDAVRAGVEATGWELSGLQKTTSHAFEGRWAGASTRSAYIFFHRDDLPEAVSVEAFLDESSDGLEGNLSLVVEGPPYGELGKAASILGRVATAARESFPAGTRTPVSLRLSLSGPEVPPERARVQLRIRIHLPGEAIEGGARSVEGFVRSGIASCERLLECPEVAEFLPPVVD